MQRPRGVWVYTLDGFGISESSETTCFQFRALAEMIRLSLPFWRSFTILNGLTMQGDIFLGSPRALYEEWGSNHLFVPYYPPPRELGGLNWITQAP